MFVTTSKGKTLLDRGVNWDRPVRTDEDFIVIELMKGYELSFTQSEWEHILRASPKLRGDV